MEINIEIRRKQLDNLDQFIGSSKDHVDSLLEYLEWSSEKVTENKTEMVKCMINPDHIIPVTCLDKHIESCAWRKENYADGDPPLSEPNPIPGSTIMIHNLTKVNILNNSLQQNPLMKTGWRSQDPEPKTSDRLFSTFTPDERLALYDYAVAFTKGPPEVPEFNVTKPKAEEKRNLTIAEIKSLERDAKRRRTKYKSKSIHMNNKSATEILRELIGSQMDEYEDWLSHEHGIDKELGEIEDDDDYEDVYEDDENSRRSSSCSYSYRSSRRYRSRSRNRSRSRDRNRNLNRSEHRHRKWYSSHSRH